ncbi:hypothetical protein F2Q70_00009278 [Brassica cretica]|uniref:FBD domain-containing protein n=1 Tax=Brassica cretica TaxID=69181 RepID=A0A8S9MC69_BRACR|nr:hypothetical protein F2Q70_00009278 [Brassica cretica]
MLVTLLLYNVVLVDVSSPVSFPCLKELRLVNIKFPGGDLNLSAGFYLIGFCVVKNEMPNIVTADFDFYDSCSWKILSSITSVRDLCLCLSFSKNAYPSGYVFHRLVNFKLCRCKTQWLNLLMCMLRASPKSRSLQLYQKQGYQADQPNPIWSELSLVPECLLTSLETVEWTNYEGTKEEKEVVEFILRNGLSLTKAFTYLPACVRLKPLSDMLSNAVFGLNLR